MSPAGPTRRRRTPPEASRPRLRFSRISILHGADLTTRKIALMEARSGREGPSVWLTAGIHGDEVGGIVVVQEIFARLRKQPLLAGRVSGFPLLNPFGFETASRRIPATQEDLNRAFPGDPAGSFAGRIAHLVSSRIRDGHADLVLDLHNDWRRSIPYVLIDPRPSAPEGKLAHERARSAARATTLPVVAEPSDAGSRATARSTLSGHLLEAGIAALTIELGATGTLEESGVRRGADAIWSVLESFGMVAAAGTRGDAAAHGRAGCAALHYEDRPWPARAGIVRFRVRPGAHIAEGTPLASVHDVFGSRLELLRSATDALVLGYSDSALAVPGQPLIALGRQGAPRHVERPSPHA